MQLLDMRPDHIEWVQRILLQHVPNAEVWAFGSRAKWLARDTSDLDLCIRATAALSFEQMGALREAFEESNLPYKVDVVDWATTSESFRKIIERDKVVVQREHSLRKEGMAGEWTENRFGSLVRFVSEKLQAKDANINTYISTENMLTNFGGIADASALPLAGSVTKFKAGDTLFSNIRTYFKKVWQARFDGCCSNDVLVLRPANALVLLPDYLHQICRWGKFTELSIRTSKGAKMPRGDKDALADFKFQLPPFAEQKSIAHILGTLDNKIELNRRMNATLEAMGRALFQSWFVDFDPVRAKRDGRQPAGMDAATAALFPDGFEKSDLGEVPRGWEVCPLSEKIRILSGGTPKTSDPTYWDGDIPWYSVRDVPSETDIWVLHTDKTVTTLGIANSAAQIFPEKTTIISARGTVGKLALTAVPMAMNQSCYGIRGITGFGDYFTYYVLRQATIQLKQRTHGTVFDTITTETFKALDCIFPTAQITVAFDQLVEPLLTQIRANLHQSRTLATLRDTLLPKLLSGELRIN